MTISLQCWRKFGLQRQLAKEMPSLGAEEEDRADRNFDLKTLSKLVVGSIQFFYNVGDKASDDTNRSSQQQQMKEANLISFK